MRLQVIIQDFQYTRTNYTTDSFPRELNILHCEKSKPAWFAYAYTRVHPGSQVDMNIATTGHYLCNDNSINSVKDTFWSQICFHTPEFLFLIQGVLSEIICCSLQNHFLVVYNGRQLMRYARRSAQLPTARHPDVLRY